MAGLVQAVIFVVSLAVVWIFAGILVEAVSRISRQYCRNGFFTAFFVLGFLTSISEFSVAINSSLAGVPSVSAGNLIGASYVILFLIVPLLAIAGGGIALNQAVSPRSIFITIAATVLPVLLIVDGDVTRGEGLLALLAYAAVAFTLYRQKREIAACDIERGDGQRLAPLFADLGKILAGGIAIFTAAHFLVEEAVYFAGILGVPVSLVGLLLLSIGTNVPELVIAARAVMRGRTDIAFGDYLGSTSMNTFIFGLLALFSGRFYVAAEEFVMTAALFVVGGIVLFLFAYSRRYISRTEGAFLLLFYITFVVLQAYAAARIAG
ncbi:MAG TPA: hypothetical protein VGB97_04580 [Candidatus Paceibacterota bacterium]|jgi:cation:H+ antiporter